MAQSFELSGTIRKLYEVQTFASGFSKREFVVEVPDGKYPQMIKFEIVKDRISQLEPYNEGDEVKVSFDIRGSEFKERFYVNLNAWKIEGSASGSTPAPAKPKSAPQNSSLDDSFDNEPDESDEIPF